MQTTSLYTKRLVSADLKGATFEISAPACVSRCLAICYVFQTTVELPFDFKKPVCIPMYVGIYGV